MQSGLISTAAGIALLFGMLPSSATAADVDITADHLSRDAGGIVTATGNVKVERTGETLQADSLRYDPARHQMHAEGNVILYSPKAVIKAPTATVNTESKDGEIINGTIYLPNDKRVSGARIRRHGNYIYEVESAHFSSCPEDSEAWGISAATAVIDQDEGKLTATHARFELGGIPILYSPYWSHPLRRKSGFLTPMYASGKRRGSEFAIPYYLAIQPNWDATFTPHWMSARGFMPELEFRHVSQVDHEEIRLDGISDKVSGQARQRARADIAWQLPYTLSFGINADYTSDNDYLADFARNPIESTKSYLQSSAGLSGHDENSSWLLSSTYRQTLTSASNAATLQIAPRLESQWMQPVFDRLANLHFDQQTTRFTRRQGVDGWRADLHPYVEIPIAFFSGAVTSSLTFGSHHTRYWLGNTQDEKRPVRTSAELGISASSVFERIFLKKTLRHSIIPSLQYNAVDVADPAASPNFDSAFNQLTNTNFMSGNRFSGHDRIEHTHRISFSLTSRLEHKSVPDTAPLTLESSRDAITRTPLRSVRTLLETSIGASYDLKSASQPTASRISNLFASLTFNPLANLGLTASGQYDHRKNFWATVESAVNWHTEAGHSLSVGYQLKDKRFANPETRAIQVAGAFLISQRWKLTGNAHHDLQLKKLQNANVALDYTHACWGLHLDSQWINRPSGTSKASEFSFQILLTFNGLGAFGYQAEGSSVGL